MIIKKNFVINPMISKNELLIELQKHYFDTYLKPLYENFGNGEYNNEIHTKIKLFIFELQSDYTSDLDRCLITDNRDINRKNFMLTTDKVLERLAKKLI